MLEIQENEIDNYFTQTVNYIYDNSFEFATKIIVTSLAIATGAYIIPMEISLPNFINNDYIKDIIEYISNPNTSPGINEREFNPEDYADAFV